MTRRPLSEVYAPPRPRVPRTWTRQRDWRAFLLCIIVGHSNRPTAGEGRQPWSCGRCRAVGAVTVDTHREGGQHEQAMVAA